jgi:hypothetical protein
MVIPDQWASYARHQAALSRSSAVSDRSWGLEDLLDQHLRAASEGSTLSPSDADRIVASGSRRARHRARLLVIHGSSLAAESPRTDAAAEARITMRALASGTNTLDFLILVAVGSGVSPAKIADCLIMSPAAVRQRVARARRAMKQ